MAAAAAATSALRRDRLVIASGLAALVALSWLYLWIALLAGFVLAEKLFPAGRLIGQAAGIALVGVGSLAFAEFF